MGLYWQTKMWFCSNDQTNIEECIHILTVIKMAVQMLVMSDNFFSTYTNIPIHNEDIMLCYITFLLPFQRHKLAV